MLLLILLTHFNGGGVKYPTPPIQESGFITYKKSEEGGSSDEDRIDRIMRDDDEVFQIIKIWMKSCN